MYNSDPKYYGSGKYALFLYVDQSTSMGHHQSELVGVFCGESKEDCKDLVAEKYGKSFEKVLQDFHFYSIKRRA